MLGAGNGTLRYFENTGSAATAAYVERTGTGANPNPFHGIDAGTDSAPTLADLNNDGDLDLVVGVSDGTPRYYENTGTAALPAIAERTGQSPLSVSFGSTLPLIAFGGQGDDSITGGTADDILFGDRGRMVSFDYVGGVATGTIVEQQGGGGPGDVADGLIRHPDMVVSVDTTVGGNDTILGLGGDNIMVGGAGADNIVGASGDDIIIGDNAQVDFWAGSAQVETARTIDVLDQPSWGDTISAGDGSNVVLAGMGDDTVTTVASTSSTLLTGVVVAGGTWTLDLVAGGVTRTFSYLPVAGDTLANVAAGLAAAINLVTSDDFAAIVAGDTLVVINTTGASFTATYTAPGFVASAPAVVAASSGNDVVIGDNGEFNWDSSGLPTSFMSDTPPVAAFTPDTSSPVAGIDAGSLGTPTLVDLNGDGDLDLVVGSNDGTLGYFENTGTATAPVYVERTVAANPFNGIDVGDWSAPTFTDLNGDGDLDLVVGAYDGTLRYFVNTGSTAVPAFNPVATPGPLDGIDVGYASTPVFGDLDDDGDADLLVGANDGTLRYFENTGTTAAPVYVERTDTANPFDAIDAGYASTPTFVDLNGDGDLDLLVGAVDGGITYFENTGTTAAPAYVERTGAANPFSTLDVGTHSAPSFGDLDGDGDLDVLVGANDGTLYYFAGIPPGTGGNDVVYAGDGNNVVVGGFGDDTIVAGTGADVILGDNGAATYTAGTTQLQQVVSTDVTNATGGNDSIIGGAGDNVIVAGVGADTVLVVAGNDIVLGDNGRIDWTTSGVISEVQTTELGLGGNDVILAGDGNNVVLGGFGTDTITTGSGTDVILGDNGQFQYTEVAGVAVLTGAQTTDATVATGGSDVIVGGGGTAGDVILAGVGADIVTTVASTSSTLLTGAVVAGDTWTVELVAGGVTTTFSYTVPLAGATLAEVAAGLAAAINLVTTDDYVAIVEGDTLVVINTAGANFTATTTAVPVAGPAVLVASVPAVVTASSGSDVVVGDNGYATWDTAGLITTFGSTQLPYDPLVTDPGGNDLILVGDGNNVVVGGFGNDTIITGIGADVVLGDNGQLQYSAAGGVAVLTAAQTTDVTGATGGGDVIVGGGGTAGDVILAGVGADLVTTVASTSTLLTGAVVAGDTWTLDLVAAGVTTTFSYVAVTGDTLADVAAGLAAAINAVTSDDYVAAVDADTLVVINQSGASFTATYAQVPVAGPAVLVASTTAVGSTSSGNDVVAGDNGYATWDTTGLITAFGSTQLPYDPLVTDLGGNDVVYAGDGNNVVVGGFGDDTIVAGTGADVILGDNGAATYTAGTTQLQQVVSTDVTNATGGNDSIIGGAGDNVIVAGVGADTVLVVAGNDIVLGDNGRIDWTTSGVISEVQTTELGLGGNDVILAGDGNNVVLGGFGTDTITTGSGTDVILGDNGQFQYTEVAGVAVLTGAQTTDATVATGGSDVIVGGGGTAGDVILAGVGADIVTTVASTSSTLLTGAVVAGDTWTVELVAGGVTTTFSYTVPLAGATLAEVAAGLAAAINLVTTDDYVAIVEGDTLVVINTAGANFTATTTAVPVAGPAVLVASVPAVVTASSGSDVVVGDNGYATWDTAGLITTFGSTQLPYDPLVTDPGGNDLILVGDGNNVVVGGFGNDTISTGTGNDTVLGDNGRIDATSGTAILVATTDVVDATGGNDIITVGDGNNLVLAGVGNDFVLSGSGADVVVGDNGAVITDASGAVLLVTSRDPLLGGSDTIATGDGSDVAIGGTGGDTVTSAGGNDVLFGDGGQVTFSAGGTVLTIESIDIQFGGNDTLDGAAGNDILIGGFGNDLLYGSLSEDLLFGSYAIVILTGGFVTSITADMGDTLTAAMLGQFDGMSDMDEEEISSLFEGLPGYASLLEELFGDEFGSDSLLDDNVFKKVFRFSLASLSLDELDVALFEEAFDFETVTQLPVPSHDLIPELPDDDAAGQGGGSPVASKELPSLLAFERAAPADTDPSDVDLVVAALGLTGLHAVQHSPSRGCRSFTWSARRTGRRILSRPRKPPEWLTPG